MTSVDVDADDDLDRLPAGNYALELRSDGEYRDNAVLFLGAETTTTTTSTTTTTATTATTTTTTTTATTAMVAAVPTQSQPVQRVAKAVPDVSASARLAPRIGDL